MISIMSSFALKLGHKEINSDLINLNTSWSWFFFRIGLLTCDQPSGGARGLVFIFINILSIFVRTYFQLKCKILEKIFVKVRFSLKNF